MNYTDIKAIIQAWTEDYDADLEDQIDRIILLAEERISKDVNMDAQNRTEQSSITPGTYWVTNPTDAVAPLHMVLIDGTERSLLTMRTESFLDDYWPDRSVRGEPKHYANWDEGTYLLIPPADKAYTLEHKFEVRLTGLSSANTTTYISTNYPGLLKAACLYEAAVFHQDPDTLTIYKSEYETERELAKAEVARQRSDATNLNRQGR